MGYINTLLLAASSILPLSISSARNIPRQTSVSSFVAEQQPIALSSLFRNIGPSGSLAQGVDAGAVIASPSTDSPDYFFQWTRDSSIVFKVLMNQFINGNTSLDTFFRQFATEQDKLQRTANPSGGYTTGGIGEPKFLVNGQAFTQPWGRPQLDGPAIRATVMIKYATLLEPTDPAFVKTLYDGAFPTNSLIKSDLEYIANNWQTNGFDLWEEVQGQHFFTGMVQQRALTEGAELANLLGDTGAATFYTQQATAIRAQLNTFFDSSKGFIIATLNNGRSGLNCGTLLGSLHGNGARGFGLFEPNSDEVLVTLQALVNSFKTLYPINTAAGAPGVAIGRYPEDVYDGVGTSQGNPWFICTVTVAQVLYEAIHNFQVAGSITVSSLSQSFFQMFLSSATAGSTFASGSSQFETITSGMAAYADTFLAVVQEHAQTNGSLSEEFSRNNGFEVGARDLTWSYGSFLTTAGARAGTPFF